MQGPALTKPEQHDQREWKQQEIPLVDPRPTAVLDNHQVAVNAPTQISQVVLVQGQGLIKTTTIAGQLLQCATLERKACHCGGEGGQCQEIAPRFCIIPVAVPVVARGRGSRCFCHLW